MKRSNTVKKPIKRKGKKTTNSSPVIFKKKDAVAKSKARRGSGSINPFKKKNNANFKSRRGLRKVRSLGAGSQTAVRIAVIAIIPIIGVSVIYLGAKSVINMRTRSAGDIHGVSFAAGEVEGFDEIPVFPGSEFIFENHMDDAYVKDFISSGQSVYRLPPNTDVQKVYDYYKTNLEPLGWEHVLSVQLADKEKRHGEYWVKDNQGIRLYSQLNDIWYHKMTEQEAKDGLTAEVKRETERELLLNSSSGTELLPDYPWSLKVPPEYVVQYYATEFEDMKGIRFQRIGSNYSAVLEPIGPADGTPFDSRFTRFIDAYNKSEALRYKDVQATNPTKESAPLEWSVRNSNYTIVADRTVLISEISNGNISANAYTFSNVRNGQTYTLTAFGEGGEFIDFVLGNIKEKRSSYTREDYIYN